MVAVADIKPTRLRNVNTGAIVSIAPEKAERMGTEWVPVTVKSSKPTPTPKTNG